MSSREQKKTFTQSMLKNFLTHLFMGAFCLLIGLLASITIINQWEVLGINIFSLENYQHNDYMKRGPNIFKLLLFAGASIGGFGYGIVEIYRALMAFQNDEKNTSKNKI